MTVTFAALAPIVVAAVLLAFWWPRLAILLPLVLHASYRLRADIPVSGGVVLPMTLLELLIGVAVAAGVVTQRRQVVDSVRAIPPLIRWGTALFLLSATISAAIAVHPRTAWGHWKAFIVEPILYAAVLLPTLKTPRGQQRVASALLLGGMVSAGLSLVAGAFSLTSDFSRLSGVYDVPNSLALVLAPLSALAAVLSLPETPVPLRRLARFSLIPILPALLWTQSFGGVAAAAIGSVTGIVRLRGLRRSLLPTPYFLLPVVAVVILTLFSGKLSHALAPGSPLHARFQIWSVSLALIRDHPLLGAGLGTFEPAYQAKLHELFRESPCLRPLLPTAYPPREASAKWGCLLPAEVEWLVRDPHNLILSFWLQTGLLGLLAMGVLIVSVLRHPTHYSLFTTPLQAALAALLVFGLVDVPYVKNDLSLLWWVLLGSTWRGSLNPRQVDKLRTDGAEDHPGEERE